MPEPIRILHVLGTTQLGGAESRIMDLYRHVDRERVQFDFLVHTGGEGFFDKEIRELGGRIFRVPRFRFYNYFSYKKAVKDFFEKNHEFRAVQGHITSTAAIYLPIAKRAGIPLIIAHARSAGVDKGIKGVLTRLLRRNLSKKADFLFTCSELAGISVFGRKAVEAGKTVFVPNAIDCEAFEDDGLRRGDHGVRAGDTPLRRALLAADQDRLLRIAALVMDMEGEPGGERANHDSPVQEALIPVGVQHEIRVLLPRRGNLIDALHRALGLRRRLGGLLCQKTRFFFRLRFCKR